METYDKDLKKWVTKPAETYVPPAPRSVEVAADFKLIVPRAIMDKISWWMHKTDKEVSGFGSLEFNEKTNTFTVKDAILLKQKVTGTSAEIDQNGMARAMFRMKDDPNGLKWHWHSHVNMGVFWSTDDMEIIRSLGQRGWILATVFNYKEERKTAYMTQITVPTAAGPKLHDFFIDDIPTQVINYIPKDIHETWDKEYADNVTEETYTYYSGQKSLFLDDGDDKELKELEVPDGLPLGYNDEGLLLVPEFEGYIYNPCFDKTLKTHADRMNEISFMTPEELDWLKKNSPTFEHLLRQYIAKEATNADNPYAAYDQQFTTEEM